MSSVASTSDTHKIQDQWLEKLAGGGSLWQEEPLREARGIATKIKKMQSQKQIIGAAAGTFAAASTAFGLVPVGGPIIGIPFAFMGNYYGTVASVDLGFDFAEKHDMLQDLFQESETFYTSLAVRLLDRYIKTTKVQTAEKMEKTFRVRFKLLHRSKIDSYTAKKTHLVTIASLIQSNLPGIESKATEVISVNSHSLSHKEISNITAPLHEVCEYILGKRRSFKAVILHNELDTMKLRYKDQLKDILIKKQARKEEKQKKSSEERHTELKQEIEELKKQNEKLQALVQTLLDK